MWSRPNVQWVLRRERIGVVKAGITNEIEFEIRLKFWKDKGHTADISRWRTACGNASQQKLTSPGRIKESALHGLVDVKICGQ